MTIHTAGNELSAHRTRSNIRPVPAQAPVVDRALAEEQAGEQQDAEGRVPALVGA